MRHGSSNRRPRNRNNSNRRSSHKKNQVYDSSGPDVRIRGTANQVTEKYVALAKDAASSGDRILAESYLQHAEHYQRIVNEWTFDAKEQKPKSDLIPDKHSEKQPGNQPESQPENQEEDLGLPASILGEAPAKSAEREKELEV